MTQIKIRGPGGLGYTVCVQETDDPKFVEALLLSTCRALLRESCKYAEMEKEYLTLKRQEWERREELPRKESNDETET